MEKSSGSGRYDRVVRMIEESEKLKSTAEDKASRMADRLVPYTPVSYTHLDVYKRQTLLICNESNGDTDKDKKWTEIIGGMTIYKDACLLYTSRCV